jgi:hypothetical protein
MIQNKMQGHDKRIRLRLEMMRKGRATFAVRIIAFNFLTAFRQLNKIMSDQVPRLTSTHPKVARKVLRREMMN